MKTQKGFGTTELLALLPIAFFIAMLAAWVTHVVTCLIDGSYGFLIAGAILFPIAIVHGVMIWFGAA